MTPPSIVFAGAVLVVVAAVISFAVSGSETLRVVAFVVLAVVTVGVVVYLYQLLIRTRSIEQAGESAGGEALRLGDEVSSGRVDDVVAALLRDAHALQRGVGRFADAAAGRLADGPGGGGGRSAEAVAGLLGRQRDHAAAVEGRLTERLEALGQHRGRAAEGELLVSEWLYERLLAHSVLTNARHAYGLAQLTATSHAMLERLAAIAGDEPTGQLAQETRREAAAQAAAWGEAWDVVLDAFAGQTTNAGADATHALLDEAAGMEQMRARLLEVTLAQTRQAGLVAGAEDAGLQPLLAAIARERDLAGEHARLLRERARELGRPTSRLHSWETFAAARASAASEHVRGYKLARDLRDVIAADHLEIATLDLLEHAARRASDTTTADLAARMRAQAAGTGPRCEGHLDSALEIALLAE
ncbi:MAG TPA: hypothetical protein VGM91_14625 [Conexibacter sp.]|jgi:hypothetical protein